MKTLPLFLSAPLLAPPFPALPWIRQSVEMIYPIREELPAQNLLPHYQTLRIARTPLMRLFRHQVMIPTCPRKQATKTCTLGTKSGRFYKSVTCLYLLLQKQFIAHGKMLPEFLQKNILIHLSCHEYAERLNMTSSVI